MVRIPWRRTSMAVAMTVDDVIGDEVEGIRLSSGQTAQRGCCAFCFRLQCQTAVLVLCV